MKFAIALLVVFVASVECVDRLKLAQIPPPQKNYDADKHTGDWYMQARLPPCTWSGSGGFSNPLSQYKKLPSGNCQLIGTWRSDDTCASAVFNLSPKTRPGVYVLKDPLGDLLSGDLVIVATDYKKFAVEWGCSKVAVDGTCADPYLGVRTRRKNPSPHTWKVVEAILDHYWSITLPELIRDVHDENACLKFDEPVHQYAPSHSIENMYKKY